MSMYIIEIGRMLALPHGAALTAPDACAPPVLTTGLPGRNGARCFATPIGPMPGPPPPCGMQNVLWRLRWQTSAPMSPGPAQADHRVHVRAVHVHLPAVLVDDVADLDDRFLEHAVRRRIRHHQRGEIVLVLLGLRAQVGDVDVSARVGLHDHDLHPRHHRARRVRPVRRLRNEADVAVRVVRATRGTRGSRAARRTRPASRRSAAATRRRSR